MKARRILVSGASGIIGYGILRSLKQAQANYELIGTTIYRDSAAPHFCDILEIAPHSNDSSYLDWLMETVRSLGIDLIIPGIEIDLFVWSRNRELIGSTGCSIALNTEKLIDQCKDKWLFYQNLLEVDSPYAITSSIESDFDLLLESLGLPFLLKPRCGHGSKGLVWVDCEETWDKHGDGVGEDLLAQSIVGNDDQEYTIAVFGDGSGGYGPEITMRRTLSPQGFTERAFVCSLKEAKPALNALCSFFKPLGPTNFQFRMHNGNLKLLEINPRISSSTFIRSAFGFNESLMAADFFLDGKFPLLPNIRQGHAIRYTEEIVSYEDRNNI